MVPFTASESLRVSQFVKCLYACLELGTLVLKKKVSGLQELFFFFKLDKVHLNL